MRRVDEITFELSKKQAGRIYQKLKPILKMQHFQCSVIKHGMGLISNDLSCMITVEDILGFKLVVLPKKNRSGFVQYATAQNFTKTLTAILEYWGPT